MYALVTPQAPSLYPPTPQSLDLDQVGCSPAKKKHRRQPLPTSTGVGAALPKNHFLPNIVSPRQLLQQPQPPYGAGVGGGSVRRSPREVTLPAIAPMPPAVLKHTAPLASSAGSGGRQSDSDDNEDGEGAQRNSGISRATSSNSSVGERRASRLSEGQMHATKKATARVLKMMSSINISKTSRMISAYRALNQEVVAKMLFKNCRVSKKKLNKEEFFVLMRGVIKDCIHSASSSGVSFSDESAPMMSRKTSSVMPPTTERSVNEEEEFEEEGRCNKSAFGGAPSDIAQHQHQQLRREDTDPIFALLDEEGMDVLQIKHVKDRFFSVALASPADILARVIRLVFTSTAYYILESTISRFELQMMSDLVREEILGTTLKPSPLAANATSEEEFFASVESPSITAALQKMHAHDRETLVAYETSRAEARKSQRQNSPGGLQASPPGIQDPIDDDDDDDATLCALRDAVYESLQQRKRRLARMLVAVGALPNLLNNAPRGCLTVRHLRSICETSLFEVSAEVEVPPSQENGWCRHRENVVQQRIRYDESYLSLANYLQLTSSPALARMARVGHLVTAASKFIGCTLAASGNAHEERGRASLGGGEEEGIDPILAEAVEDYQRIHLQTDQNLRSRSGSLMSASLQPPPQLGSKTAKQPPQRSQPKQQQPRGDRTENLLAMASQADLFRRTSSTTKRPPTLDGPIDFDLGDSQQEESLTASPTTPSIEVPAARTNNNVAGQRKHSKDAKRTKGQKAARRDNNDSFSSALEVGSHQQRSSEDDRQRQHFLDFPPEHGNPQYESRNGVVFKSSNHCPQGRPLYDHW